MKIFDTHVHFNSEKLSKNFDQLIQTKSNFSHNNIGTTLEDSLLALKQALKYANVYCSLGIHPLSVNTHDMDEVNEKFNNLLTNQKKVVAVGETGLDFYRVKKEDEGSQQCQWLLFHAKLAKKFNLPLILHIRNAHKEAIFLLKTKVNHFGIIHAFDGDLDDLYEYLKLDKWMISISPLATRNLPKFKEIIKITPIKKLLIESDAPWLINNSSWISELINLISEIKALTLSETAAILLENSLRIFNLNCTRTPKDEHNKYSK